MLWLLFVCGFGKLDFSNPRLLQLIWWKIDTDSREIQDALFARTSEENGEIRGEALVGLARRNDERAFHLVRNELSHDYVGSWVLEAAE
jgi:hypothetical protein